VQSHFDGVIAALCEVARPRRVWPRGLVHRGGPHVRLGGMPFPISIGGDECRVLERMIEVFRPEHAFVVGDGFGLSSCFMARVMEAHGGRSLVTLDSEREGDGERCAATARRLAAQLGLKIWKRKCGRSPEDVARSVEVAVHPLIFIDGDHRHPQPTLDFEAALPYGDAQTIFVWHDHWLPGVAKSVAVARNRGLHCLWLPTSCEMVIGTRDSERIAQIRRLLPGSLERPPARSRIALGAALLRLMGQYVFSSEMPPRSRSRY
jgi:predicted O-methyltransferase YrrM